MSVSPAPATAPKETSCAFRRARPAGLYQRAVASVATAEKAPAMPIARAPMGSCSTGRAVVPGSSAARAGAAQSAPTSRAAALRVFI
jgi:hypothetical protein